MIPQQQIDQIFLALHHGEVVIIQDDNEQFFLAIGGAGKDMDGDYRINGWCFSKKECLQNIGDCRGYSKEKLIKFFQHSTYIGSFAYSYAEPVPVGTKVYIKENAREEQEKQGGSWNSHAGMDNLLGKTCEVEEIKSGYYGIYTPDKSDIWYLVRTAFTLVLPANPLTTKEQEAINLVNQLAEQGKIKSKVELM